MKAQDAAELISFLQTNGVELYVDGGWAVDAVLGQQTRDHSDLDIAIPERDAPRLRELMSTLGYRELPRYDAWECNFVLTDALRRQFDVHSYTLDEARNNIHGVPYSQEQLTGKGVINGCMVCCVPPEWLVKLHTGYEPDENDYRDVKAIECRSNRWAVTISAPRSKRRDANV